MTKERDEHSAETVVVAVTTDLLARSRLEDAATRAGWRLEIATAQSLDERLDALQPAMLVLDLDAGRTELLSGIEAARSAGLLPARVIGFLSHVDAELTAAARAAGCETMPRGKFWRALPDPLG
jgi:DNA-binding response OmpR family regulator